MANRYCNLVGSKKISEDFQNINIGFDAVQKDMDSKSSGDHRHPNATDTTDGFMSAQDKAKMDASTAAATPGTLVQRDASGRMKAAAPSAKTDVARKAEVDAVQSDLDSHKSDAVMHVTEADHEKLGSIEDGAEVNQPAFSRVNDIEAGEKTDALTFKGGIGIKITTNPNSKEVTITASGESTPGAHGSSHTEHGSDPIPNATAKEGGLMSSDDKAEFDKIAPEVPKQAAELKEHAAELEDHEQRIDGVEAGMADVPGTPLELLPGLRVVETEQDAPFQMGEVKGRTLLNLNGKDGNFDYRTSPLPVIFGTGEIISTPVPTGTKAQKVVSNRAAGNPGHFAARYELNIDRSKHYIAVAYMDNVSCDAPVYFSIAEMKDTGYTSLRLSGKIAKGSGMQYLYTTISPAQMENREKLVYYFRGEGTSGAEFRIGPFAFYEITADEYDAIAKMTPEQVAERYPYVDSMTNVTNPYAIVTGGNLLPSFYHMGAVNGAIVDIQSAYEIDLMTNSTLQFVGKGNMEAKHKTYRIDFDSMGTDVKCYFNEQAAIDAIPIRQHEIGSGATIEIGDDTKYIGVFFGNMSATGSFKVKNPMLVPGTEPKPFSPQQRSMLAFETELAAHPVDGSNSDTLFMGDDGLPYVLEAWKKVTLDALEWNLNGTVKRDFKIVTATGLPPAINTVPQGFMVDYKGALLTNDLAGVSGWTSGGCWQMGDAAYNNLYLSIANADSGWGSDYNPSKPEIAAFFNGWKAYQVESNDYKSQYNGTGTIRWVSMVDWSTLSPVGVIPTEVAPGYTPYRLQYLKAKPTVEPVWNYEVGATLSAGSNIVEVGSGIVIREKANPRGEFDSGWVYIAVDSAKMNPNAHGSETEYKTKKILSVYRDGTRDSGWKFDNASGNAWGNERAYIWFTDFDPTAVYHITYTMLDPTLAAPISGTVARNLRGTVSDLVQDVGDIGRRLSVVETQKAEKDAPQAVSIVPLNGWQNNNQYPSSYRRVDNLVHLDVNIANGATTLNTVLFRLPSSVAPKTVKFILATTFTDSATDLVTCNINILPSGDVVASTANGGALKTYVKFNGIYFI